MTGIMITPTQEKKSTLTCWQPEHEITLPVTKGAHVAGPRVEPQQIEKLLISSILHIEVDGMLGPSKNWTGSIGSAACPTVRENRNKGVLGHV